MQYKQANRILLEIIQNQHVPIEIVLAATNVLCGRQPPPKLGPYRKRSPEQSFWRVASDSMRSGAERWCALSKLLRTRHSKYIHSSKTSYASCERTESDYGSTTI